MSKKRNVIIGNIIAILFIIISFSAILFGIYWIIISGLCETFSPKYKTYVFEQKDGSKLICNEKYSPSIQDVIYLVDFKIMLNKNDTLDFGEGIYPDNKWQDKIQLMKFNDWYMHFTKDMAYSKILLQNQKTKINKEHLFSLANLKNDSIWKLTNKNIQARGYGDSSKIDSTNNNSIFVKYSYQKGLNKPFTFILQTVEYDFDSLTGIIKTKKVYPPKESKKIKR